MRFRLLAFFILIMACAPLSRAQTFGFDEDIKAIHDNAFPQLDGRSWQNGNFGEYTQYVPAATLLTLKITGVKGKNDWWRFLSGAAIGAALVGGTSWGLKTIVDRTRPNGGVNSFPSGHTTMAFASAALLNHEYGWRSPWYGIAGYSFAMLTAIQRVATDWHWMSDTMFGMLIGIGGVELGYFINDVIWKQKGRTPLYDSMEILPQRYYNGANWNIEWIYAHGYYMGSRAEKAASSIPERGGLAALQFTMPLHRLSASIPDYWSLRFRTSALSMRYSDSELNHNRYGFLAGGCWSKSTRLSFLGFDVYALGGAGVAQKSRNWASEWIAGGAVNVSTSANYKVRLFTELDWWTATRPCCQFGWSVAFCW